MKSLLNKKAQLTQGLRATEMHAWNLNSVTNPTLEPNITSIGKPVRSYGHFCISKMATSRHLGFYQTTNSAIRSTNPENPGIESNMECITCTVCKIFAFKLYCDLEIWVWGHSRSSKVTLFDRAHMALYSYSIVNTSLLDPGTSR